MRSIILQPIFKQPEKAMAKIVHNLSELNSSANPPQSNLLNKKTRLPALNMHHQSPLSKNNTKHRRYKTEHRVSKLNPQRLISITNSKSFDDLAIKDSSLIIRYDTLEHSKNRRKVRLNNKKFSYCIPIKTKNSKVRRMASGQFEIGREQRLSVLIPNTKLEQIQNKREKHIMFNPQVWKSYEFDKVLRERIKLLLKNRQNCSNPRHGHTDLYE